MVWKHYRETVYAKGTILHMLSSHAFSQALRAHILTLVALINVLIDDFSSLNTIDIDHFKNIYSTIFKQEEKTENVVGDSSMINFNHIVSQLLDQAAEQNRTGKLWVQYARQVMLLQNFIRAERTGDWELHLYCVQHMIPYFHEAGYLHYAKAARIYLQDMEELKEKNT